MALMCLVVCLLFLFYLLIIIMVAFPVTCSQYLFSSFPSFLLGQQQIQSPRQKARHCPLSNSAALSSSLLLRHSRHTQSTFGDEVVFTDNRSKYHVVKDETIN